MQVVNPCHRQNPPTADKRSVLLFRFWNISFCLTPHHWLEKITRKREMYLNHQRETISQKPISMLFNNEWHAFIKIAVGHIKEHWEVSHAMLNQLQMCRQHCETHATPHISCCSIIQTFMFASTLYLGRRPYCHSSFVRHCINISVKVSQFAQLNNSMGLLGTRHQVVLLPPTRYLYTWTR